MGCMHYNVSNSTGNATPCHGGETSGCQLETIERRGSGQLLSGNRHPSTPRITYWGGGGRIGHSAETAPPPTCCPAARHPAAHSPPCCLLIVYALACCPYRWVPLHPKSLPTPPHPNPTPPSMTSSNPTVRYHAPHHTPCFFSCRLIHATSWRSDGWQRPKRKMMCTGLTSTGPGVVKSVVLVSTFLRARWLL